MIQKLNITKRADNLVRTTEAWVAFAILGWQGLGTIGMSGMLSGLATWAAQANGWLVAFAVWVGFGLGALVYQGTRALWAHQRAMQVSADNGTAWSHWSKLEYSHGKTVEGGTHYIHEIFKSERIKADMVFRDCILMGPGVFSVTNRNGTPPNLDYIISAPDKPSIIHLDSCSNTPVPLFFDCSLINCKVVDCLSVTTNVPRGMNVALPYFGHLGPVQKFPAAMHEGNDAGLKDCPSGNGEDGSDQP